MSITAAKALSPKQAVDTAVQEFHKFFRESGAKNILLEALDYDEIHDEWVVKIGFDVGRTAITRPGVNAVAALVRNEEIEPVREVRTFILSGETGALKRIDQ